MAFGAFYKILCNHQALIVAVDRGTFRMSTAANFQGWPADVLIKGTFLER